MDFERLPGLRDYSGALASHTGHGLGEILKVVTQLSAVGIPSCVVGVRALRYYGAGRATDEWDLCVPDDKLDEAQHLLLSSAQYETVTPPPSVPGSLRHTFPCMRLEGYNFWIILVPSSDCFVDPSSADHVEKSHNGVPYASLAQFARSVLVQQQLADIGDLIDGMDLDMEWGKRNIGFEKLQEESVKFAELRTQRLTSCGYSGGLSPQDMARMWQESASKEAKERRIEPLKQGRYFTRWRSINRPEDPRTRDRPV
ncbi:hypothetical protein VTI74DRAFT_5105 [Chaetomium olivicolor]